MNKQTVTVNGVTLSREQVEKALEELNKPPKLPTLTRVKSHMFPEVKGVVLNGWTVQQAYIKQNVTTISSWQVTVVMENGDGLTYDSEASCLREWEPLD